MKRFKILTDWESTEQLEEEMEECYNLGYRFVSMTTASSANQELVITVLMELKDDV